MIEVEADIRINIDMHKHGNTKYTQATRDTVRGRKDKQELDACKDETCPAPVASSSILDKIASCCIHPPNRPGGEETDTGALKQRSKTENLG